MTVLVEGNTVRSDSGAVVAIRNENNGPHEPDMA